MDISRRQLALRTAHSTRRAEGLVGSTREDGRSISGRPCGRSETPFNLSRLASGSRLRHFAKGSGWEGPAQREFAVVPTWSCVPLTLCEVGSSLARSLSLPSRRQHAPHRTSARSSPVSSLFAVVRRSPRDASLRTRQLVLFRISRLRRGKRTATRTCRRLPTRGLAPPEASSCRSFTGARLAWLLF